MNHARAIREYWRIEAAAEFRARQAAAQIDALRAEIDAALSLLAEQGQGHRDGDGPGNDRLERGDSSYDGWLPPGDRYQDED
jgi:hypothetical protein